MSSAPMRWWHGPLHSAAVLTVVPVPAWLARGGLAPVLPWAPAVGAGLGLVAAGVVTGGRLIAPGVAGGLLTAAVAIAGLAWWTRGLHLDGLADTVDGLGRLGPAERSLEVMSRSDIGPFGVGTLVLTLLIQTTALAVSIDAGRGAAVVLLAVVTGRLAMMRAGLPGLRAARPSGLGAQVVGTVPRVAFWLVLMIAVAVCSAPLVLGDLLWTVHLLLGLIAGLAAAEALLHRAIRRLGGVTGDVLGALCEVATTAVLVTLAVG